MTVQTTANVIWIEVTRAVPGFAPGLEQPSVGMVLRLAKHLPGSAQTRLAKAFPSYKFKSSSPNTASDEWIVVQLGGLAVRLLQEQGMPAFSAATVQRVDATAFRLLVPTVAGLEVLTRTFLIELTRKVDSALAGHAATAPTSPPHAMNEVLARLRQASPQGKNMLSMLVAAHRLGIPWTRVYGNTYLFGQGSKGRWFDSTLSDRTSAIAARLARQKHLTGAVLRSRSLPVPRHRLVTDEKEALAAAAIIGFPVVVKPADLDRGIAVAAGLRSSQSVQLAYREAARHSKLVLVEEHIEGEDYRIHVFEGEVFRVRHRVPGGVNGDGVLTVKQLLQLLNADPRRGPPGSNSPLIRIDLDAEAVELLHDAGLDPDSVPAATAFVRLRRIANVSVGGVSVSVAIEHVHPDNLALARRAVAALKLDLAAVDLLIPDISRSWVEGGGAICEVNAQPQFGSDAPEWLFRRIFPTQGRIPIVAVVGNGPGASWVGRLRVRLVESGMRFGFCDTSGAWVGHERLASVRPLNVFQSCRLLISHEDVDALLFVADRSLLADGLPSDRLDVVAFTHAGTLAGYNQLGSMLARCSARVICDTATDDWYSLRPEVGSNDCLEVGEDRIVELLMGLLTRTRVTLRARDESAKAVDSPGGAASSRT